MEELFGAYGEVDSENGQRELSVAPSRTTAPPHVESVQARGEVQMECPFNLGDRVYDDVFESEGVVIQLPIESETQNRGKVLVKFDDAPDEPTWRTWGHCKVAEVTEVPVPAQRPPGAGLQRPRDEMASEEPGPPAQKPKVQKPTFNNFFVRLQRDSVPTASGARSAAPAGGASSSAAPRAVPPVSCAATAGARSSTAAAVGAGSSAEPAAEDVPKMSSIERDRKLKYKPASQGKTEDKGRGPAAQGQKHPIAKLQSRIAEFPDASLVICKGRLRCTACECDVSAKTCTHSMPTVCARSLSCAASRRSSSRACLLSSTSTLRLRVTLRQTVQTSRRSPRLCSSSGARTAQSCPHGQRLHALSSR